MLTIVVDKIVNHNFQLSLRGFITEYYENSEFYCLKFLYIPNGLYFVIVSILLVLLIIRHRLEIGNKQIEIGTYSRMKSILFMVALISLAKIAGNLNDSHMLL